MIVLFETAKYLSIKPLLICKNRRGFLYNNVIHSNVMYYMDFQVLWRSICSMQKILHKQGSSI